MSRTPPLPARAGCASLGALCAFTLLSCGCTTRPRLDDEFAGGVLTRGTSPLVEGVWVYRRPGMRLTDYTGFMVERVQVYPYTGPAPGPEQEPSGAMELAQRARDALRREMIRHGYAVSDVPQRGVLRLKGRIRARPIPDPDAGFDARGGVGSVPIQLVSLEVDLVDSVTRKRVYSLYDEDRASRMPAPILIGSSAATQTVDAWARLTAEHIDHEYWRGISAAGPPPELLPAEPDLDTGSKRRERASEKTQDW